MHYHIKFVIGNRLVIPTRKTTCPVMWPMTISSGDVISHGRQLACLVREIPLWRHQMETFSAFLSLSAGNPPVTGGFPWQMPVTWSFDVFFDLRLSKRLSKQSIRRWFDTPSRISWRNSGCDIHCWPRMRLFTVLNKNYVGGMFRMFWEMLTFFSQVDGDILFKFIYAGLGFLIIPGTIRPRIMEEQYCRSKL